MILSMKDAYQEIEYEIIKSRRESSAVEIRPDGRVIVRLPLYGTKKDAGRIVREKYGWILKNREKVLLRAAEAASEEKLTEDEIRELTEEASRYFKEKVAYYAEKTGVTYGRITLRMQKTRWGSCSSEGNLSFNILLMLAPPEVRDSVIVHELCHRFEMNHQSAFYEKVLEFCPEYRERNLWLKKNGPRILSKRP